jgi:3-dehydroquinate dehydratase
MRTHTEKAIQRHLPRTEMSRAERRRLERDNSKAQNTYTLTQAQIDQMKKEVSMEATKKAFIMMMGFPLLTLRDKFGFGKERLNRFMDKMLDLYEAYEMDYVDLDDLNDTIMKETGVTLIKKREGKY